VVNSIISRAHCYPEKFGEQKHPDYGIKLWNRALKGASRALVSPRAKLVVYEDFISAPDRYADQLTSIPVFSGFARDDIKQMSLDTRQSLEPWKNKSFSTPKRVCLKYHPEFLNNRAYINSKLNQNLYRDIVRNHKQHEPI
tara:strand:- start:151 stop:573 length:423 start_codon:yes stop_codon:yes gene_type:complete